MKNYLDLLSDILNNGEKRGDRTGTGTISVFGRTLRFDLQKGFPLVTTKKIHWKSVVHELLWFLKGDTNVKYLQENGVRIWNEWADENGELGPVYGSQWRNWGGIDQLSEVINKLKTNPTDRRLVVSAWNVGEIPNMALPPCHMFYQFYVSDNKLSCQFYMRSTDCFLGLPFNIASYALLTHIVAKIVGLDVGELIYIGGDTHIYQNHLEQVREQLKRNPGVLPEVVVMGVKKPEEYTFDDIKLVAYFPQPHIAGKVAV